ncbi:MAG: molybdopterin-binding protein [Clostridium sp.]|uniref:molybdopterin-binding protein n=1 Tax=Clostridium sp. TaxID=1506 RepID=UPI003040238D
MKSVKVEDSIGMVVAHDLTKIVANEFKGARFKKGHIIELKDIEEMKSMGKNHVYVLELDEENLHEDDAVNEIVQAIKGNNIFFEGPKEGKINLLATTSGLLKVNLEMLYDINSIKDIVVSTLHNNTVVKSGDIVAATKVTPLVIEKKYINEVKELLENEIGIIKIKPFVHKNVGIIITGTEVYEGIITDKFAPLIKSKVISYGASVNDVIFVPDDLEKIVHAIEEFKKSGFDLIICSGGMSVDADDVTPIAIEKASSQVITYGAPVIPGAMFMLAYSNDIPIIGIPACGMFFNITIFDVLLPRLMANDKISRREISKMSHGGLCLRCNVCNYPICPFCR